MSLSPPIYQAYLQILKEELIPALGCTEPISIAFASAKARQVLGGVLPDRICIYCSGSIIKNVKSVVVPNSGSMKGIIASIAIGVIGGDPDKGLEVLAKVTQDDIERSREYLENLICDVILLQSPAKLHFKLIASAGSHQVLVEIMHQHTNIIRIELDGKVIESHACDSQNFNEFLTNRDCLNVADILDFSNTVELDDIRSTIETQITYNVGISNEGMLNRYGANVGKTLIKNYGNDLRNRAKAAAAAGSDARMSGCGLPVVINSGSGNQGLTVSLPVIVYAQDLGVKRERLLRALVCSNLIAIHQKSQIGRLSAYCGAVSAACGSGAGINYLYDGSYERMCMTITNTIANVSGILCDGAKPSCAAKIASAVDAAILGHTMAMENDTFKSGDGIVKSNIEKTIFGIGKIASQGMLTTDQEILSIMVRD